jgi:hypothetical protein
MNGIAAAHGTARVFARSATVLIARRRAANRGPASSAGDGDVLGLQSLLAFHHAEFDPLTVFQ